jgi:hypothetical protein
MRLRANGTWLIQMRRTLIGWRFGIPAAVPKLKRAQGAIRPRVADHIDQVGTTIIAQVRSLRSGLMVFPVHGSLEIDL